MQEERDEGEEKIFEVIIITKFPKLMKDISQNNQDARQTSSRINVWKNPQVNTSESNCQIPNTDNLESK